MLFRSKLRPNPIIYMQSENWSLTGADPIHATVNSDQFGYFTQTIETGGKRQRRVELSQETQKLTSLERELLEKQIASKVKQAYWAAAGADRIRQLWVEQQENFRQTIEYHEIRVREGALAESELLRVRLEADRFSVAAAAAELEAERARIALLKEMGETDIRPVMLTTTLDMAPVPLVPDLATAIDQRAETKVARQEIDRANANLKVQRSLSRPNIEAGFGYKRNLGFNTLLFTTQFGLPISNKNQGNIQAALSEEKAARASLAAAEAVVGDLGQIRAVSIGWHDDVEAARSEIERAIAEVARGAGVLLLTDMFGGTPTNIAAMFLKEGDVEIVTGVNLPMVIKLASLTKEISLGELAREVEEQGKDAITRAGMLLETQKLKKDA